jgi:hypothetical protein
VSTSGVPHLLYLGASLYVIESSVLNGRNDSRTKLTVPDPSCLGADRSDMFSHAFPNPVELTDRSPEEDRRGIVDGDGSSV